MNITPENKCSGSGRRPVAIPSGLTPVAAMCGSCLKTVGVKTDGTLKIHSRRRSSKL